MTFPENIIKVTRIMRTLRLETYFSTFYVNIVIFSFVLDAVCFFNATLSSFCVSYCKPYNTSVGDIGLLKDWVLDSLTKDLTLNTESFSRARIADLLSFTRSVSTPGVKSEKRTLMVKCLRF